MDVANDRLTQLRQIARYSRLPELRDEGRDRLIRFLDAYATASTSDPIVDSLCVHFGLFPYVSPGRDGLSTAEALAYEFHRPDVQVRDTNFVFHADQASIFHRLLNGESIILSAPTSFGKSAILDALVASERWNNLVVIVPTVALIDEVRRRLVRLADNYNLVTHPSQAPSDRNIFVMTQERYLELPADPPVDLFMIDEFYKLGHSQDDQRMSMLNIAWNRLRETGAQYYLTGPNVDSLAASLDEDLRDSLVVSHYRTVAVDVEDRSHVPLEERLGDLEAMWDGLEDSTLVFVSAPSRAERMAVDLSSFEAMHPASDFAVEVARWLADNFDHSWRIVDALLGGVGTHTGPMPRSLQRIMIRLFEDGAISTLVCTTTLIEGVNTSAKNVVVFDKAIDKRPIDYFTFSNVRGRAGRMARHYLGRVVTYMPPPAASYTEVDIPIDSQSEDAPLASLVQLPSADLSDRSRDRLDQVLGQSDLSIAIIKANKGFDPDLQVAAARALRNNASLRRNCAWSGYPTSAQARAVINFGFTNLLSPRQRRGMNVNRLWGMLNSVRDSAHDLSALVDRQMAFKFAAEDRSDVVAGVLAFQRNWMGFTIPSFMKATQRIYNEVADRLGEPTAAYDFYISQVESLFLAPGLLDLDEYGLPLPLAHRLLAAGALRGEDAAEVISSLRVLAQRATELDDLSVVERWIIEDVVSGLGLAVGQADSPS